MRFARSTSLIAVMAPIRDRRNGATTISPPLSSRQIRSSFGAARTVSLYELRDGRFQFIEHGPVAPFMSGYQYLVVEQTLATFIEAQGIERVRFEPAILFNRKTGEELRTHVRLRVGQFFNVNQLRDLSLEGLRLLTLNDHYYFASPELKARLEDSPFQYLRFTEGLSELASYAT